MDKVKGGKIIATLVGLIIILFVGVSFFHYVPVQHRKDVVVAFVGFFGSVIGGAITLIGVRATISSQYNADRLNKLPDQITNIWKLRKKLIEIEQYIIALNDPDHISRVIETFYNKNEDWMTETSAKVDGETYITINRIFTLLDDFKVYYSRGEKDVWFQNLTNLLNSIDKKISALESEFKNLSYL